MEKRKHSITFGTRSESIIDEYKRFRAETGAFLNERLIVLQIVEIGISSLEREMRDARKKRQERVDTSDML